MAGGYKRVKKYFRNPRYCGNVLINKNGVLLFEETKSAKSWKRYIAKIYCGMVYRVVKLLFNGMKNDISIQETFYLLANISNVYETLFYVLCQESMILNTISMTYCILPF